MTSLGSSPFANLLWRCLAALLLALGPTAPAVANHIAAALVAEGAGTPGGTVILAFDMRPEPGWHGYWSNPGDAGFGMSLDWSLPAGATIGAPRYPVPRTLLISGLMNHVYESEYAVLMPLTLPRDLKVGTRLPIRVKADWLACTDRVCVPERAELAIELPIVAAGAAAPNDPRFAEWTRRLPAPLGAPAHFAETGNAIRLGIPLPASIALAEPHFFPSDDGLIAYAAEQRFSRKGDLLIVELQRRTGSARPPRVGGVLRLNQTGDGLTIAAVPGGVPSGGALLAGAGTTLAPLPLLLLAALAGGLLLNVMPCVFPILSLKALSLARAGESPRQARHEGLAYTAGVVIACVALGALLLILRAAGQEVGWAFQLQEPGVVAALLLLAVVITANLLGLFEFAVPGFASSGRPPKKSDLGGAFATGLLAAFVATPCTGPFMAAAMGAALLLPVPAALALFAALGLGVALPFLAIAFVPPLRRALPRPGVWMERFRRWMALPMGLTALALLWLASRLGGFGFAAASAALALAVVLLLARVGRGQRAGQGMARVAGAAIALAGAGLLILPATVRAPSASAQGILPARPFSETALATARAGGKPVFAWFTADWCLTCKLNEELAIERPEVRDTFARAGVTVLRGDWTRRDPAITRFLTEQGAAGVPLYIWYPAGGGTPQRLPQVLTSGGLTALVPR